MSTKAYISLCSAALFSTLLTVSYMEGRITTEAGLQHHEAAVRHSVHLVERRYEILAAEADFLSVLDADKKWRREVGQ